MGRAGWYSYYAGFSSTFAAQAIANAVTQPECCVLDPWNGSGTTTQAAQDLGIHGHGYDINPVMVVVAKARTLTNTISPSIPSLLEEVLHAPSSPLPIAAEPLEQWLTPRTATHFRRLERRIHSLFINFHAYNPLAESKSLSGVSSLAAFFYVALFRSIRKTLTSFRASNPTWIKLAADESQQVELEPDELARIYRNETMQMLAAVENEGESHDGPAPTLDIASSYALPLGHNSVDVVVTSPPYCTRIDYVVKTSPELALLGATEQRARALRDRMIGTPTITPNQPVPSAYWGKTCNDLLGRVYNHTSRASRSYYWKTHVQYFDGLFRSIGEINRTLKPGGNCIIVVQDSYYKDVRVDLAQIVAEMAMSMSLQCIRRTDFQSRQNLVGINSRARRYDKPAGATETVITFEKEGRID